MYEVSEVGVMFIKKFLKKVALAICLMNMSLGLIYPNTIYAEEGILEEDVVEAEGEFRMGGNDTLETAKEIALANAERYAVEKVGIIVKSISEVENFKLKKDSMSSYTFAKVQILDKKTSFEDYVYRVVIKARVIIDEDALKAYIEKITKSNPGGDTTNGGGGTGTSIDGIDKSKAMPFKGHFYQVVDVGLDWHSAKAACESKGGHLVTIGSSSEQDFIANKLLKIQGQRHSYWLGAEKTATGKFVWLDKTPFDYTNWASGQPDNLKEKALMMYRETNPKAPKHKPGMWNDLSSDGVFPGEDFFGLNNFGFICEWDS